MQKSMDEPMQIDVSSQETNRLTNGYPIVENTTLDLESYIKPYEGYVTLSKLLYIIDHCPLLKMEALRLALDYVRKTHDTNLYHELHKQLKDLVNLTPNCSVASTPLDNTWIQLTNRKAQIKLDRLDGDLKNYKNNSVKESIRRGSDDLGDHYLDMGDLGNALKCYLKARDYCTSPKHVIKMCLNVIKISIFIQNWPQVVNYIQKAEHTIQRTEEEDPVVNTMLKCATGLADLVIGKYKPAAKSFLQASFDHFNYPELLSVNNVAIYGTLCALATFDRQELQKNVISSSGFKMFLETEPLLRNILDMFNQARYHSCLTLMEEIKDNLSLDNFLAPQLKPLYLLIRNKALCQYFSPYLSADMHKMAEAFNTSVKDLEDELMQLILEGQINARIDSHNKVLYAKDTDQRSSTFEKSISVFEEYQWKTKAMILRSALIKHRLRVMAPFLKEQSPVVLEEDVLLGSSTSVRK